MPFRLSAAASGLMLAAAVVCGQNPNGGKSTGQENELLPDVFQSLNVNGPHAKSVQCYFCDRDLYPTVAVIAFKQPEKPTEPFASLLQKLEARVAENKVAHFGAFAIFLTLDKTVDQDPTGGDAVAAAEGLIKELKLK